MTSSSIRPVGDHLRDWRRRRRVSQLGLALDAEISQRHLSFVESGRAKPSRDLVLLLAERLDLPLRDRNAMLLAAGYAPVYAERPYDDPALQAARDAVDLIVQGHEPFPALAVDRRWTLVSANPAVRRLLRGVADSALLEPPVNVLRVSLHPGGLAPIILNLPEWRDHLLQRLRREIEITGDAALIRLMGELRGYGPPGRDERVEERSGSFITPLRLTTADGTLSLISCTTVFGAPVDVTVSELALETFFPADARSAELLRLMAGRD